jgi:hypothetical protein
MIRSDQEGVLNAGLDSLSGFGRSARVRGRFVALYLGLRRMHDGMAPLGGPSSTPAGDIERFLDEMFTKTHRLDPLVVLTAPFGGSHSSNEGYSTRSGQIAPGHRSTTNTWRNNFGIQKGIGCPAEAAIVGELLHDPALRLACPHIRKGPEGQYICSIEDASYRGEEHSIWLRRSAGGYQVVDLDLPNVYEPYLMPSDQRIPLFALIAVLYSFAPTAMYPSRETVGIPDFADDFYFSLDQVGSIFDVDPESEGNGPVLQAAQAGGNWAAAASPSADGDNSSIVERRQVRGSVDLPPEADPVEMNTGLGAERLVAEQLIDHGWTVRYCGNQRRLGFDLEARRSGEVLCVEVKSSVGFAHPELTESEWAAAQGHGEGYMLAVVDFYGVDQERVWYVRDPAGSASTSQRSVSVFRLQRSSLEPLAAEAEFL